MSASHQQQVLLQLLLLSGPVIFGDAAEPPPTLLLSSQIAPLPIQPHSSTFIKIKALYLMLASRRYSLRTQAYPCIGGQRITLAWLREIPEMECRWRFRFSVIEIAQLIKALDIPIRFITTSRHAFPGIEALCLLLARLRTAGELPLLSMLYKRSTTAISLIINEMCQFLNNRWSHLLDFDHTGLFKQSNLVKYAYAFHTNGQAPLSRLIGLIDCTIRRNARPRLYQRVAYNGHKKYHALKYQALMLPNGLIGHLYGPIEGRRADPALLAESGLLEKLERYAQVPTATDDTPVKDCYFYIYGDPAYGVSPVIQSPFAGAGVRTPEEQAWNARMAGVRIEVEHGFAGVIRYWPFLNAFWKLRVFLSPIALYYRIGILLTNAMNCLHPNQTSQYFDCMPPSLNEYFHD